MVNENWFKGGWCETYRGHRFYFDDHKIPSNTYELEDIAHALSLFCRYGGHVRHHYSVGQHVCLLAKYVYDECAKPPKRGSGLVQSFWPDRFERAYAALHLLHHDDSEFILGDMVRPLKVQMPEFKHKEKLVERQIALTFGLEWPMPEYIKEFDNRILVDERQQVMNPSGNLWDSDVLQPLGVEIARMTPEDVEKWYLDIHKFLSAKVASG